MQIRNNRNTNFNDKLILLQDFRFFLHQKSSEIIVRRMHTLGLYNHQSCNK